MFSLRKLRTLCCPWDKFKPTKWPYDMQNLSFYPVSVVLKIATRRVGGLQMITRYSSRTRCVPPTSFSTTTRITATLPTINFAPAGAWETPVWETPVPRSFVHRKNWKRKIWQNTNTVPSWLGWQHSSWYSDIRHVNKTFGYQREKVSGQKLKSEINMRSSFWVTFSSSQQISGSHFCEHGIQPIAAVN